MTQVFHRAMLTAALGRGFAACAAVAALILYNSYNCVFAQEWQPDDYRGNLSVEALFDWEVPVSVVSSGAYEATWFEPPSDVHSQTELDARDYVPTNGFPDNRYFDVLSDMELPFYQETDWDMDSMWADQLSGYSPDLTGDGEFLSSLGTSELSFSELGNITTDLLYDDMSVVGSSFTVASVNWRDFLKTSLTMQALEDLGIGDAFSSISTSSPVLSWLSDWYDTGAESVCNFLNRPALSRILRGVYCLCCVAAFWFLAYTHLVKVLWGPLQAILGSFGGGNK